MNWANNFGQIRLGEQCTSLSTPLPNILLFQETWLTTPSFKAAFDSEAAYIKYPVLAIAGVVAIAQALPLLVTSLLRSLNNLVGRGTNRRFTTRDSFARGRGDYAVVDEDEGELLGEDSDEDV